jgi:serine/threonine-protein kinase
VSAPPAGDHLPPSGQAFLDHLVRLNLVSPSMAGNFVRANVGQLAGFDSATPIGEALVAANVLTRYQFERILAGLTHGLVLGNYRVLARIGAGGMGIVFRGEHALMHRQVAIKVLPVDDGCPADMLQRFYNEMRVLAQLNHPNIVTAYDSGRVPGAGGLPMLLYLVMELIDGCDLELYVHRHGPVPIGTACRWICQAATGLQEAHHHGLIHRDVKPSNLLLANNDHIKLVDFGLVRQFSTGLTDPKAMLGTVEYMSPEQATDPSSVGTHADIYALGATLFLLLTGQPPYPPAATTRVALEQLQAKPPRQLRQFCPDAPPALEAVLSRLLDRDPLRRPPMALTVERLLAPYAAA